MLKNIILLSLITILISSCSFSKQNRSITPYFNGTLKFGGQAIENSRIMLSLKNSDSMCQKAKQFTKTDDQGKFSLKATTEEYTYTPFANYALDEWVVCAEYNNQIYTLYSNNRYGSGHVTGSVLLDCDLALKPLNQPCNVSN